MKRRRETTEDTAVVAYTDIDARLRLTVPLLLCPGGDEPGVSLAMALTELRRVMADTGVSAQVRVRVASSSRVCFGFIFFRGFYFFSTVRNVEEGTVCCRRHMLV